jgi:Family of unknown function (DUF6713)
MEALVDMPTIFYYLGISFLFTHEMDAVMQREWQLLYFLRDMNDQSAYAVFLVLHVPAFFLFFWLGHHPNSNVQSVFRRLVAGFLIVHAGIHFYNASSPANHFDGVLSNVLIYAAGLFGLLYFAALRRQSVPAAT